MLLGALTVTAFFAVRYVAVRAGRTSTQSLVAGVSAALVVGAVSWGLSRLLVSPPFAPVTRSQQSETGTSTAPHPSVVPLNAAELRRLQPDRAHFGIGFIDKINGVDAGTHANLRVRRGTRLTLLGWAATPSNRLGSALVVIVDGKRVTDITRSYGSERPDVAREGRALRFSGFTNAEVATAGLQRGQHILQLGILDTDRAHYFPIGHGRTIDLN